MMQTWEKLANYLGIYYQSLETSTYLYINGFILLKFLDRQVIWRSTVTEQQFSA